MPATEQTWRNQKVMHVVFGASALVMTVATLWLLAKDHNREWKEWQLKARAKDAWLVESTRDALQDQYSTRMETYEEELQRARSQPVEDSLISQFQQQVRAENRRLSRQDSASNPSNVLSPVDPDADSEGSNVADAPAELTPRQARKFTHIQELAEQLKEVSTVVQREVREEDEEDEEAGQEKPIDPTFATRIEEAVRTRAELTGELASFVSEAKRRQKQLVGRKKTVNGFRTAAVSEKGLMVHDGATQAQLDQVQQQIDSYDDELSELTTQIAAATDYRSSLEALIAQINAEQDELVKQITAMQAELARLDEKVYKNRSNVGEWITRWPVLNALYDGNIRIVQNWLPDLTINYNFSQVARFDRCVTCHRNIATTAPGTATDPLYPTLPTEDRELTVQLETPTDKPDADATLRDLYGLVLSDDGIVDERGVTVHYTLPESAAAAAGIRAGDLLESVAGTPVSTPAAVEDLLLRMLTGESTAEIQLQRGLDHPFTAHPRLDLYLTDLSPHPDKVVGCTICHDGQGSGTEFPWTSHTPNDAQQQIEWTKKFGWFDNHHWIFPMKPARFAESNCLKCHHQKGGLEPSERFPEPPAPKLVEGWSLVESYGCFGCHEVNGYAGPGKPIGPDVRLEANYHEAAAQIQGDEGLSPEQRALAEKLVQSPDQDAVRHALFVSIERDRALAEQQDTRDQAQLSPQTHKLAAVLKDVEIPGQYRKVGPSLRYLDSKVDFDWLYSWIRRPSDFRPSTKMPQFFENWEHLSEAEDREELHASMKFEPIEVRALSRFLLNNSRPFTPLEQAQGITSEASPDRGRWLFETRGCLACHSHQEFPDIQQDQGPDLSRIAAKLNHEKGRQWLYSWLKEPHKYHPRTKMPNLYLDPIVEKDAQGQPTGTVTDPAADIAEFLLKVETDWVPQQVPDPGAPLSDQERQDLADLALAWLASDAIPADRARRYLQEGIPERLAPRLKADEKLLVGLTDENRIDRHLEFVARRTISKYGCFGCHDIPGFEDAKPIGTALAEWGRKETSKLAFENIQTFLETHGIDPENPIAHTVHMTEDGSYEFADGHAGEGEEHAGHAGHAGEHGEHGDHAAHGHLDPGEFGQDDSYYIQAITSHSRDGFIWQKLRYPRSYDYKATRNKGFNERLRMPKFAFSDTQREAVVTFVLGLVSEPPADKFVYRPDVRGQAIVDGRHVLEKYNCAGCHTLKMEQWEFDYHEDTFDTASSVVDYPFLKPGFTAQEIADSLKTDARGMLHASVHGMPILDEETGAPYLVDEDRSPITLEELVEYEAEEGEKIPVFYPFTPWENALLGGEPRLRGVEELLIPASRDGYGPAEGTAYPAWGGDLARYLFTKVVARAKESNPQVNAKEAWGWLPPPLMEEGKKVQTDWLHGFLMDPVALRPAVVMRMPNFHMSSDDASKLVNYFAAMSDVEFPYEYKPQQRESYLATVQQEREDPLAEAMNIVVNGNYCVKCHAVSDFYPQGDANTFGPNLANVYRRLRPEYLRDWIANPARVLPYTGMPVNIPYRPGDPHLGGVSQDLYSGTSLQQLDGLVSLLSNFDTYVRARTTIQPLVEKAKAEASTAAQEEASADATDPNNKQAAR